MVVGKIMMPNGSLNSRLPSLKSDEDFPDTLLQLTNGASGGLDERETNVRDLDLELEDSEKLEFSHEEISNMLILFNLNNYHKDEQIFAKLEEGTLLDMKTQSAEGINLLSKTTDYESIGFQSIGNQVMEVQGIIPRGNQQIPTELLFDKAENLDIQFDPRIGRLDMRELAVEKEAPYLENPTESIEMPGDRILFEEKLLEELTGEKLDLEEQDAKLENLWADSSMDLGINPRINGFKDISTNGVIDQLNGGLNKENIEKVSDTIIESMKTTTIEDVNFMEVQLYPEELGDVNISLKFEQGKLTAKILVDNDNVKGLFLNSLNELNTKLEGHKINIEKVDIELNTNVKAGLDFNSNPGDKHYPGEEFSQNPRGNSKWNGFSNMNGVKLERTVLEKVVLNNKGISILV